MVYLFLMIGQMRSLTNLLVWWGVKLTPFGQPLLLYCSIEKKTNINISFGYQFETRVQNHVDCVMVGNRDGNDILMY